jgi:arsenate reductase
MREKGIDISRHESRGFDEGFACGADLIVTMGCGDDACPAFVGKRIEDWALEDPAGKDLETFRRVRDEIERRVRMLLDEGFPRAAAP